MRGLREFLDVETQLRRESAAAPDAEERERRKRAGRRLLEARGWSVAEARKALRGSALQRRRFALAWREALVADGVELDGATRLAGWRTARWVLGAVGLALGVAAAQAVCASPDGRPVNLWLFLGVLVLLPLATLVVLAGTAAWASAQDGVLRGFVIRAARWLQRRVGRSRLDPGPRARRVESWLAFGASQLFAAAFAVGTLLGFGTLLLFSGLSFGWSATPAGMEPTLLQSLVEFLAAPFGWAAPDLAPGHELVAASRWAPLEGAFPDAAGRDSAELADAWWPFLLAAVTTWSLLPRLLLLGAARHLLRRNLRRQRWDHSELIELYEHMLPTGEGWSRAAREGAPRPELRDEPLPPPTRGDGSLAAVVWGGWRLDEAAWSSEAISDLGLHHAARVHAGGRAWEADAQALALLSELEPEELWVLVEAGESPDKRLLGFLRDLRRQLPRVTLRVGLADWRGGAAGWAVVRPRDARIWRRTLDGLEDDRLWTGVIGPDLTEEDEDAA